MDGGNAGPQRATAPVCSVVGFFLGLAATSGYFFVTITPCWYVSYAEATISPYENCYGLWKFCSSSGLCGDWLSGSLLGRHGAQRVVCRSLMIIACVLCAPGLLLNIFGMKCVLLFHLSQKTKETFTRWSAATWILSGTLSLVSSTWYALDVMHSVWKEGKAVELSDGIFTGWGSVAFAYAAAMFLWIAASVWRRERKSQARTKDSPLASVAAAKVASGNGSGLFIDCTCHLASDFHASRDCTAHRKSEAQSQKKKPRSEHFVTCSTTSFNSAKMTYL